MDKNNTLKGYTLIELVMVITISSILSIAVGGFISRPITAYSNVLDRAELVDASTQALQRMVRDIQRAVPNSLRVKQDPNNANRIALEMVNIVEGMRYRATAPGLFLDFANPVSQFNVIGQFQFAHNHPICITGNCRLVVYNTGANTGGSIPADNPSPGANVYSTIAASNCSGCLPPPGSVTITPPTTTVTLTNPGSEGQITLSASTLFALPSTRQRIDIVDTPITYICDTSAGIKNITRYSGYPINSVQPTDPTAAPLNTVQGAQLTKNVTGCNFTYQAGSSQNNGIITLSLTLTSRMGETITLIRQVGVNNSP